MTSVFSRLFPPPNFLTTPGAGLDISDESIKALFFQKKGDSLALGGFFEEKIPEGVLVGGEIKNKETLITLLSDFRKKNNLTFVHTALPEERSYVVRLRLENVARSDIKNSIELQLVEHIPLPPDQVVFDYTMISEEGEGKGPYDVSVAIVPETLAYSYTEVLEGAGFNVLSLETETEALARALVPKTLQAPVTIFDFGETRTGVSLVWRGSVIATATVPIGGRHLTEAIAKEYNLPREEAEIKKRNLGLARGQDSVFPALVGSLAVLADELNKHLSYWNDGFVVQSKGIPVQVFLAGGSSLLPGLAPFLSSHLGISVTVANPWITSLSFDESVPDLNLGDALRFAPAIGLGLRSFV